MRTEKEIIIEFKKSHGNSYNYSNLNYVDRLTKVNIICKEHGQFTQTPAAHISGQGCPVCGRIKAGKNKSISFEVFFKRANKKHGNKFKYDQEFYKMYESPCKIICPEHGSFFQTPKTHIKSSGCPKCGHKEGGKKITSNKEKFINSAVKTHNDKYLYDKVDYAKNSIPVSIICKIHGEFKQKPNVHLLGGGCPKCGGTSKLTQEEFINKSKLIHGDKYDYSKVYYKTNKNKVVIICSEHGEFSQSPSHHTMGSGCPTCNESKGEKFISSFLKQNKILFNKQQKFDECINKRALPFDFYLPEYNLCIEFDGEQHFETWRLKEDQNAKNKLEQIQKNDAIKNKYCQEKNIILYRIKYTDNLQKKLNQFLNEINRKKI